MTTAILTAICTILFGGVASALITYLLASYKSQRELHLQKLEQLYSAFHRWSMGMRQSRLRYRSVVMGTESFNNAIRAQKERLEGNEDLALAYENLQMTISLYFPELKVELDRVLLARKYHGALFIGLSKEANRYRDEQRRYGMLEPQLDEAQNAFEAAEEALITEIRRVAYRLNRICPRFPES